MDDDCIEVIDLAGPEDSAIVISKRKSYRNDIFTVTSVKSTDNNVNNNSKHYPSMNMGTRAEDEKINNNTRRKCRHKKCKKKKNTIQSHDTKIEVLLQTESQDNNPTQIISTPLETTTNLENNSTKKKKRCSRKKRKQKTGVQDDIVIISGNLAPPPFMLKSSVRNNNTNHIDKQRKKRTIKYDHDNRNLDKTQDVNIKHNKCDYFIIPNIITDKFEDLETEAQRNKTQENTKIAVPTKRILPSCFRKNCCKDGNYQQNRIRWINTKYKRSHSNVMNTKQSAQRRNQTTEPEPACASKTSTTVSSDSLYEDISQDSFESYEEIDVLIKRFKERENERILSMKTNESKAFDTGFSCDLSDISDEFLGSDVDDNRSRPHSIHSQITTVLETIYSPTCFSPLPETDRKDHIKLIDCDDDMSLDTVFSLPSINLDHFKV